MQIINNGISSLGDLLYIPEREGPNDLSTFGAEHLLSLP